MEGGNIIRWNVANWVTILLMAAAGFMVIAIGGQLYRRARGGAA